MIDLSQWFLVFPGTQYPVGFFSVFGTTTILSLSNSSSNNELRTRRHGVWNGNAEEDEDGALLEAQWMDDAFLGAVDLFLFFPFWLWWFSHFNIRHFLPIFPFQISWLGHGRMGTHG